MIQILFQRPMSIGLNDCRQPHPGPHLPGGLATVPLHALHSMRPHVGLRMLPLDNEYVVAFVPSLSQVVVLNREACDLLERLPIGQGRMPGDVVRVLALLAELGLLTATSDDQIPVPASTSILTAWLHITNDCTLRCSYCYIRKTAETMSRQTGRAAVDAVIQAARLHGYDEIALKYAGGEAAMELPLVEDLHRYAVQQTALHGLRLQATLLSNGVGLSTQHLTVLQQLAIQVTISLDGSADIQDEQRPTRHGQGSYAAVMASIERAIAAQVIPTIALTITERSVATLPETVQWLLERDLPFTISFYRPNLWNDSHTALHQAEEQIIAGLRQTYAVIERHPPRWSVLGALLDRVDMSLPHLRACAAGQDYLVIDQHGQIARCQMSIRQPVTSIEHRDPLTVIRTDPQGLQNLPVSHKSACRSCEWRYWCGGGCPVATYRATGRYDLQSPNCNIYMSLYPDLLRLEGRRLLYWQGVSSSPQHEGENALAPSVGDYGQRRMFAH